MIMIIIGDLSVFKLIQILVLSSVKFFLGAPYSFILGLSYFETFILTTLGGILGTLFFFYLSNKFLRIVFLNRDRIVLYLHNIRCCLLLSNFFYARNTRPGKQKKVFTFKNRMLVRIKRQYGLPALVILTPVVLSIPLGTFLVNRYYSGSRMAIIYLSVSVVAWSAVLSVIFKWI